MELEIEHCIHFLYNEELITKKWRCVATIMLMVSNDFAKYSRPISRLRPYSFVKKIFYVHSDNIYC